MRSAGGRVGAFHGLDRLIALASGFVGRRSGSCSLAGYLTGSRRSRRTIDPSEAIRPELLELAFVQRHNRVLGEAAHAGENHPALVSVTRKSFNKKHDLPASTIEAVEDALVADRQELGRMLARSAFAQEAVIAAAKEARRRLGRDLPPPPQKLSNRPPRRRPAR